MKHSDKKPTNMPLEITNKLNDVYDALREIQLMTDFLGRAVTGLSQEYSEEYMYGGRLCFDLLDKRTETVCDQLQKITTEVKDHENLTQAH